MDEQSGNRASEITRRVIGIPRIARRTTPGIPFMQDDFLLIDPNTPILIGQVS